MSSVDTEISAKKTFSAPSFNKETLAARVIPLLVLVAATVLVVSRRPDAVSNPQFWAEDGTTWYADAYNGGIAHSLFLPYRGSLHTFPRLIAAFAQVLPLGSVPFFFNIVAMIIQVLPAVLLVSSRFARTVPSPYVRMLLAFVYIALPGSAELDANLSNGGSHLALLAFMVIMADGWTSPLWRIHDVAVIILSGLTGPFSILLAPVAGLQWQQVRSRRSLHLLLLVLLCASIQLCCLFILTEGRPHTPLGPSVSLLVSITAGKLFLTPLIGERGIQWATSLGWDTVLKTIAFVIGSVTVLTALLKGPRELRLFLLFAGAIFMATLVSPPEQYDLAWWEVLSMPESGGRYWFMPSLAFLAALMWMIRLPALKKTTIVASMVCMVMAVGVIVDWRHSNFADLGFQSFAKNFKASPKGAVVDIPINPAGWHMTLIRH